MDVARSVSGRGVIAALALVLAATALWASVSLASGGSGGSGGPASVPAQSQSGGGDESGMTWFSGTGDQGSRPSDGGEDCPEKDGREPQGSSGLTDPGV